MLFTAILPQFVNRSLGHVPLQMVILGAVLLPRHRPLSDSTWAVASDARAWLSEAAGAPGCDAASAA